MTHAGDVFVFRDLHLWPFDPKINGFPGHIVAHVYVQFGDFSCATFLDVVWKNKRTNQRQINATEHSTHETPVDVRKK